MQKWELVLEKYFVTQGGYFRIGTAVALGMEIKYENLLFYHGISGNNRDKDITTRKKNDRTVFGCFNNLCLDHCYTKDLNILHISIDDSPPPKKIMQYL